MTRIPIPIRAPVAAAAAAALLAATACRTSYPVRFPPKDGKPKAAPSPPAPVPGGSERGRVAPPPSGGPPPRDGAPGTIDPTSDEPIVPLPPAPVVNPVGTLRVGIALERESLRIGAFGEGWSARAADRWVALRAPFEARVVPGSVARTEWHLQTAALADRAAAQARAKELAAASGLPAKSGDATLAGLYPVLLGSFATREEALALREKTPSLEGAFPVSTSDPGAAASFLLEDVRGSRWSVTGREVDLFPPEGVAASFGGDPYRGAFRVRLGTKGKLHLVNVVGLEDYLRGVVPAEMGPRQFPEPEALAAQAVAARSYALRRRGESTSEGYDLCATPRCQVYKGMSVEDPLANQAIDATAGLVLTFGGQIADTMFTSTCGGHTDAVGDVFPGRSEPYLTAVPCSMEGRELPAISGTAGPGDSEGEARGAAFGRWLEGRGVKLPREISPEFVLSASNAIRFALGGPPMPGRPRSVARGVLVPVLLEAFRLSDAAQLFDREADRSRLAGAAMAAKDERLARSTGLLRRFGWDDSPRLDGAPGERLPLADWLPLAGDLAEATGLVERIEGRILPEPLAGWMIRPKDGGAEWVPSLAGSPWLLWERIGDAWHGRTPLSPLPADRVVAWADGPNLLGLVVERSRAGAAADRDSSWSRWTRRVKKGALLAKIRERRPEVRDLLGIDPLERSATGRITKLEIRTGGEPVRLRGLDIRFVLDLPESLAAVVPLAPPGREPEWLFLGRGWGHGVGLCQWGAFGLALAGEKAPAILERYFPGTSLERLEGW